MTELTENCAVKIAVRERPAAGVSEEEEPVVRYIEDADNVIFVDNRPFVFDYILNQTVKQAELFDELVRPLVDKVREGFNCTALAYGQTGTGKSYTMGLSCDKFEDENAGIVTRCLREFFKLDKTEIQNNIDCTEISATSNPIEEQKLALSVSYIEIYNEKLYDLLSDNYTEPIVSRGYKFTGGQRKQLTCLEDCRRILLQGTKNRHVRPTVMNTKSSRSHAIFTIHVRNRSNPLQPTTSCLNLVDLAGSESIRRTGHQGMAMTEGVTINKGLLSIGKVLHALSTGQKVVPYRDSVLSSVLQDSLNPNSFLTLIACISPHREDLSESLSTLRFAQNAKQLKTSPYVNVVYSAKKKSMGRPSFKPNTSLYGKSWNSCAIRKSKYATNRSTIIKNINAQFEDTIISKQNNNCSNEKSQDIIDISSCTSQQSSELSLERTFDLNYPSFVCPPTSNQLVTSTNQKAKPSMDASEKSQNETTVLSVVSNLQNIIQSIVNKENTKNSTNQLQLPKKAAENEFKEDLNMMLFEALKPILRKKESLGKPASVVATPDVSLDISKVKCQLEPILDSNFKKPLVPKVNSPLRTIPMQMSPKVNSPFITIPMQMSPKVNSPFRSIPVQMNPTFADTMSSTVVQEMATVSAPINLRRSTRPSVRPAVFNATNMPNVRSSERHCKLPIQEEDVKPKLTVSVKSEKKIPKKKETKSCTLLTILEGETKFSKFNLNKHRKNILNLLNAGSLNELKSLPRVGGKTANQIIFHRCVSGPFKNLKQVENLPVWQTKTIWNKFAKANLLSES